MNNKIWRRSFFASFGLLPMMALFPIYNVYVPVMLQTGHPLWESGKVVLSEEMMGFALSPSMSYFIMTWDNLAGVLLAWWVGKQADLFSNSRKPWIIIGVLLSAISFAFLPTLDSVYTFLFCILLFSVGLAIFRTPALAWIGDLFEQRDRSRANGMFMMTRGVIGVAALIGAALIYKHGGIMMLFIIAAAVAVSLSLVAVIAVDESRLVEKVKVKEDVKFRHLIKEPRVFPLLVVILMLYMAYQGLIVSVGPFAKFDLKMDLSVVPLALALFLVLRSGFSIPFGILSEKWGHEKSTTIGLALLFLVNILGYLFVRSTVGFFIYLAALGPLIALTVVSLLPMLFETCKKVGHATTISLFVLTVQIGAIIGPISFGWLVEASGSNRTSLISAAICVFISMIASYRLLSTKNNIVNTTLDV